MRSQLDLKGNELLIYACIYGFSQTDENRYKGSLQYLADWCGATKQGVLKNLKSLIEKGLIIKTDKFINGVKFVEYHTTEFNTKLNCVEQGIKHSLPNNKEEIKEEIKDIKKERKKDTFDSIVSDFTSDQELQDAIFEYIKMRKLIKNPMTDRALRLLLQKLKELSTDRKTQIAILNQSIIHNWKSVYPLKEKNETTDESMLEELKAIFGEDA